jgi:glycosyltransferase involved in cell wall biosynthesis
MGVGVLSGGLRKERVLVVSNGDPTKLSNWAGTPFFALRQLRAMFETVIVHDDRTVDTVLSKLNAAATRAGFELMRQPMVGRLFARLLAGAVARERPDLIISIGATHKIAFLPRNVPMVHVSDALFGTITAYYPKYAGLSARTLRLGNAMQQRMLDATDLCLLASDWAVDDARRRYDTSHTRLETVPLGTDFGRAEPPPAEDDQGAVLRLLFVGYDWVRKDGAFAVATLTELRKLVPGAELSIVGPTEPPPEMTEGVTFIGRIAKSSDGDRLASLYRSCTALLVPSRQEAYGVVYCEAASFGKPAIGRRTGGVPTIITDGVNGLLIEEEDSPAMTAERIAALWRDQQRYRQMCADALQIYRKRFTWTAWGEELCRLIDAHLNLPRSGR